MKYINWNPENDSYLKEIEMTIHDNYHNKLSCNVDNINNIFMQRASRLKSLKKILSKLDEKIAGNILEVGAGDAWCSVYLLGHVKDIKEMHIMEINESAVKKLIPSILEKYCICLDNITLIKGSFNDIKNESYYDYVFAMGSLHHSSNLYKTMMSIYKSLKPGGMLLAHEPYMFNEIKNKFYFDRQNEVVNFKNMVKIKNEERTDLFYRLCEYQTAGFHAGYDVYYEDVTHFKKKFGKYKILSIFGDKIKSNVHTPRDAIFIFQKPFCNYDKNSVTAWE